MKGVFILDNLKVSQNKLVYLSQGNEVVCDSLQVAEKFKKRHDNVLRAIEGILKNEETQGCLPLVIIQMDKINRFIECIL